MAIKRFWSAHGPRVVLAATLVACAGAAFAAYPDRPVRLVVAFSPGGPADFMSRLIAKNLSDRIRQPVVVENKPGASGQIAAETVMHAPADGYTLFLGTTSSAILPLRKGGSPVDLRRDFVAVSLLAESPYLILATPRSPYKTLPELIAYARSNPDVQYGTQGVGTGTHLVGALFADTAGFRMTAVPYKGSSPIQTALYSGEIFLAVDGAGTTTSAIKDGRLVALAITSDARSPQMPNVPAVAETLPGFSAKAWYGLMAPKGTPDKVTNMLATELQAVVGDPAFVTALRSISLDAIWKGPKDFGAFVPADFKKWADVVARQKIEIE